MNGFTNTKAAPEQANSGDANTITSSSGTTTKLRPTLADYIRGAAAPVAIVFKDGDLTTRLWAVLIQPNRDLASKGWTGSDAAVVLCASGWGKIVSNGQTYAEGTNPDAIPHPDMLKLQKARYFGKVPAYAEFAQLVTDLRKKHGKA